jgi:hypothetical protein
MTLSMQVLSHISDEVAAVHGLLASMLLLEEGHSEDSIIAEVREITSQWQRAPFQPT